MKHGPEVSPSLESQTLREDYRWARGTVEQVVAQTFDAFNASAENLVPPQETRHQSAGQKVA